MWSKKAISKGATLSALAGLVLCKGWAAFRDKSYGPESLGDAIAGILLVAPFILLFCIPELFVATKVWKDDEGEVAKSARWAIAAFCAIFLWAGYFPWQAGSGLGEAHFEVPIALLLELIVAVWFARSLS